MDLNKYQRIAAVTMNRDQPIKAQVSNWSMGLSGETGELIDHLKKWIYHDHNLDHDHVIKELGDVLWYVSALATTLGENLSTIAAVNAAKLKLRYPEGFTTEASKNRADNK